MTTFLYFVWFALPTLFFLLALFAKLEKMSKSPNRQRIGDFMYQGLFTLGCSIASVLIDIYLLEPNYEDTFPDWISLNFLKILLYPLVLTIGAKLIGGTKNISIKKTTRAYRKKGE